MRPPRPGIAPVAMPTPPLTSSTAVELKTRRTRRPETQLRISNLRVPFPALPRRSPATQDGRRGAQSRPRFLALSAFGAQAREPEAQVRTNVERWAVSLEEP